MGLGVLFLWVLFVCFSVMFVCLFFSPVAPGHTYSHYCLVHGMYFWKENSRVFEGTWRKRGSAATNTREKLFKRLKHIYEEQHLD